MTTVFLRFPDREAALAAFRAIAGLDVETVDEVPDHVTVGGYRIDVDIVVGGTGVVVATETGEPREGYHVNLWLPPRAPLPAALVAVEVHPVHPAVMFAE